MLSGVWGELSGNAKERGLLLFAALLGGRRGNNQSKRSARLDSFKKVGSK